MKLKLSQHYSLGGLSSDMIEMNAPTVANIRASMSATSSITDDSMKQFEKECYLIAAMCGGLNPAEFDAMTMQDFSVLQLGLVYFSSTEEGRDNVVEALGKSLISR